MRSSNPEELPILLGTSGQTYCSPDAQVMGNDGRAKKGWAKPPAGASLSRSAEQLRITALRALMRNCSALRPSAAGGLAWFCGSRTIAA